MKTMFLFIPLIFLSVFSTWGISPEKTKEVIIDLTSDKNVKESGVFKIDKIVKLETTNDCLLRPINKVIHHDGKLFIQTQIIKGGEIFAFEESGKFLYGIKCGRGSNEISSALDFTIDPKNNQIMVPEFYKWTKVFDLEGRYVKTLTTPSVVNIATVGDNLIGFDSDLPKDWSHFCQIQEGGKVIKQFMPKPQGLLRYTSFVHPCPFTRIDKDNILVCDLFTDTIYCVSEQGHKVWPRYVLNYRGRSCNTPARMKEMSSVGDYFKLCQASNYGSGAQQATQVGDMLFFHIIKQTGEYVTYNGKNKQTIRYSQMLDESIPGALVGNDEHHVIFSASISQLLKFFNEKNPTDTEIIRQLKAACVREDDNPILLFCTFK